MSLPEYLAVLFINQLAADVVFFHTNSPSRALCMRPNCKCLYCFLSPTDLLFYRHLHGNSVCNCSVFSINYFHSLITNFRRQTFHCWPPREWIVLQRDCIREMSPQWRQKGMKTLCLIYINPTQVSQSFLLLNIHSQKSRLASWNNDSSDSGIGIRVK